MNYMNSCIQNIKKSNLPMYKLKINLLQCFRCGTFNILQFNIGRE